MSDPVRSIRVASALADRFRALLTGGSSTESELELAIGEANQLYPEIWRHLDEAYRTLRAEGRDPVHYEQLRAKEGGGQGVTNINYEAGLDWRLRPVDVKVASFNAAGYQRAVAAVNALKHVMPEVDFEALARADEEQIKAAGSFGNQRWKRTGIYLGIGAALILAVAGIHRVLSKAEVDDYSSYKTVAQEERDEKKKVADEKRAATRVADEARWKKIDPLKKQFVETCDAGVRAELVKLYTEGDYVAEAKRIETMRCVIPVPTCESAQRIAIVDRLAPSYPTVMQSPASVTCTGVRLPGNTPALAYRFSDASGALRGVATRDGTADLIPLTRITGTQVGVGDLDGDGVDELINNDTATLFVTRLRKDSFYDVTVYSLPKGCAPYVTIVVSQRPNASVYDKALQLSFANDRSCADGGTNKRYALGGDGLVPEN